MQAEHHADTARDIVQKLVSIDPVEFDSAINQYFDANATLWNPRVELHGATRIKHIIRAHAYYSVDTKVFGEPKWDEQNQHIDFAFRRLYVVSLPVYVPMHKWLTGYAFTATYDCRLKLNPVASGSEHPKLLVTKLEAERREMLWIERAVPWGPLRPLSNILIVFIAAVVGFLVRHPPAKEGVLLFLTNILLEVVGGIFNFVVAEKEKGMAHVQKYADDENNQLPKLWNTAYTTATDIQNQLEQRAKAAGVPVDEYKAQAYQTTEELRKQAEKLAQQVQERAMGLARGGAVNEAPNHATNNDDIPHTPNGGHDPLAPNAPSYAEAAAE